MERHMTIRYRAQRYNYGWHDLGGKSLHRDFKASNLSVKDWWLTAICVLGVTWVAVVGCLILLLPLWNDKILNQL
jgi:hypothetical protein